MWNMDEIRAISAHCFFEIPLLLLKFYVSQNNLKMMGWQATTLPSLSMLDNICVVWGQWCGSCPKTQDRHHSGHLPTIPLLLSACPLTGNCSFYLFIVFIPLPLSVIRHHKTHDAVKNKCMVTIIYNR